MKLTEKDRINAIQHVMGTIFNSQKILKTLAPEYNWSGLGNLLGDYGECIAIDHYKMKKAPAGAAGHDAITEKGKTVQIKTNNAAKQIGFRGESDLILVLKVLEDGSWKELYFGAFDLVKASSSYSSRDNKYMISLTKLEKLSMGALGK